MLTSKEKQAKATEMALVFIFTKQTIHILHHFFYFVGVRAVVGATDVFVLVDQDKPALMFVSTGNLIVFLCEYHIFRSDSIDIFPAAGDKLPLRTVCSQLYCVIFQN